MRTSITLKAHLLAASGNILALALPPLFVAAIIWTCQSPDNSQFGEFILSELEGPKGVYLMWISISLASILLFLPNKWFRGFREPGFYFLLSVFLTLHFLRSIGGS